MVILRESRKKEEEDEEEVERSPKDNHIGWSWRTETSHLLDIWAWAARDGDILSIRYEWKVRLLFCRLSGFYDLVHAFMKLVQWNHPPDPSNAMSYSSSAPPCSQTAFQDYPTYVIIFLFLTNNKFLFSGIAIVF